MTDGKAPFVLLDDARTHGAAPARLLTRPAEITVARRPDEVPALLERIGAWHESGAHAAGYIAYEAGHAIEPRLADRAAPLPDGWPLGWFARFDRCERIAAEHVPALLPDPAGAALSAPNPRMDWAAYRKALEQVLDHIRAGDIYQANLTFAASVAVHGAPLAAYARLRSKARAGYGGVVFTGSHWLLSQSPELFLSIKGRMVMARPMKGTAARQNDPAADKAAVAELAADPKQRAENLMIVDLLRNDLSRVALPGSVTVPSLFRIESYPTIHQMVSDIAAELAPETGLADVLARTFPCGSITGAPKISAMEVIDRLESEPRGAYTGSIGFVGPGDSGEGEAAFNVAIRTLALRDGAGCATVGLGSGVVADSKADAEWQECLAKGEYIRVASATFDLIETMAFDPLDGVLRIDGHMERLGNSARTFGFAFDRHGIRNMLQHATFRQREAARIRLRLSRDGHVAVLVEPMPETPQGPVAVAVSPLPVDAADIRLRHKTSDRAFYDEPRKASGTFEVLFTDDKGRLTEGSFTNIFVERDGVLLTPPLTLGLLPGVLRTELIAGKKARESELTIDDLADGFLIGNALRGLMAARLA
ncbi:aminodeoxychorismate synthase component I [Sphingomonas lacunae]|uniref:Probable branched-chain-amino-acid aminotransferase n=1 Tax=Sphingomonas lacunae TaxID=2698828 RepID=A0A6M4AZ16_9SPHN|nr:aminodeoxychorismate synthase component I [Sphingomonas lacunae]